MRFVVVLALLVPGCMAGVGPTLAINMRGEVSAGAEASEDFVQYGLDQGVSFDGSTQGYLLAHGFAATDGSHIGDGPLENNANTYYGGAVGVGMTARDAGGIAETWLMAAPTAPTSCERGTWVPTIQAGIRWRRGLELFVAPKENYRFHKFCL